MRRWYVRSVRLGAFIVLGAMSLIGVAYAHDARAVDCSTLPSPLYLQVGDTQEPLMKELGRKLRDSTVNPMTLIYKTSGSCTNIEALYTGIKLTTNPSYVPSTAEDAAWNTSLPALHCTIPVEGVSLDVGVSALFVQACNPNAPPAGIGLFQGPVQPYLFVVPEASGETALTSEEAYFVFGYGDQSQAQPWTDEAFMFIRTSTKSTLLTLAAAIGVPADKWQGLRYVKSSGAGVTIVDSGGRVLGDSDPKSSRRAQAGSAAHHARDRTAYRYASSRCRSARRSSACARL